MEAKTSSTWTTDPLFMKTGSNYYFYQNDHLGTPQKLTAINGAVVWNAKYSSFGKATVDAASTITNNLRYPGQVYDEETGLHYNYFRYYDPNTGRYLRADPIGLLGGINLFVYALGNPINRTDFLGLASKQREVIKVCVRIADVPLGTFAGELGIYHMWIKTSYTEVGLGPMRQNVPRGSSPDNPFAETSVNPHTKESEKHGTKCFPVEVESECIAKSLKLGPTGKSCVDQNCNEWTKSVIEKCGGDWKKVDIPLDKWTCDRTWPDFVPF